MASTILVLPLPFWSGPVVLARQDLGVGFPLVGMVAAMAPVAPGQCGPYGSLAMRKLLLLSYASNPLRIALREQGFDLGVPGGFGQRRRYEPGLIAAGFALVLSMPVLASIAPDVLAPTAGP